MVIFSEKWKKYNEIQLIQNKIDLNNEKIKNPPPSPVNLTNLCIFDPTLFCFKK